MSLPKALEDPKSSVPSTCFPLLSGVVIITAGGSCIVIWSMHSWSFEFQNVIHKGLTVGRLTDT